MRAGRLNNGLRFLIICALVAAVAAVQVAYDVTKLPSDATLPSSVTPETVRMLDMGFHAPAASFLWVNTMPEILDLFNDKTEYLSDVQYLTSVDPKLGYPYAFSVLTLPAVPTSTGYTTGVQDALTIGREGLVQADPDWRIPYYMAVNYYLELNDAKDALLYFNIAAQTPGIPYFAERFAENFGNGESQRNKTIELWQSIRDTTNDPATKERAQAYIDHLEIFNYLEAAAAAYKKEFHVFPTSTDELVARGIIPAAPQDPFGFVFMIDGSGTAYIDTTATSTQ